MSWPQTVRTDSVSENVFNKPSAAPLGLGIGGFGNPGLAALALGSIPAPLRG